MTRKGDKQVNWTTKEEHFLRENAGLLTRREICHELKKSRYAVEQKASRLGLSLRCFTTKLTWCDNCATWRTSVSPVSGHCRVCAKREMLERSEQRVSDALALLNFKQRTIYLREESNRGRRNPPPKPIKRGTPVCTSYARKKAEEDYLCELERWEIVCLDQQINANKTRLKRIRQKLGTNPRKNK